MSDKNWRAYYIAQPYEVEFELDDAGYEIWTYKSRPVWGNNRLRLKRRLIRQMVRKGHLGWITETFINYDDGRGYSSFAI